MRPRRCSEGGFRKGVANCTRSRKRGMGTLTLDLLQPHSYTGLAMSLHQCTERRADRGLTTPGVTIWKSAA